MAATGRRGDWHLDESDTCYECNASSSAKAGGWASEMVVCLRCCSGARVCRKGSSLSVGQWQCADRFVATLLS